MIALAVRAPGFETETVSAFQRVGLDVEIVNPVELVPLKRPELTEGLLSEHDVVVFTSPRTVEFLSSRELKRVRRSGVDVAAIGPRTREALEDAGLSVDVVPTRFTTEELARTLRGYDTVLALRSKRRTEVLRRELEKHGVKIEELEVYDLKPRRVDVDPHEFDVTCFFSAFTARCFLESVSTSDVPIPVVSIGPITTRELRRKGLEVVEAEKHTVVGVAETARRVVERYVSTSKTSRSTSR